MKMNEKQSNEVIRRLKEDVEFFKQRKLPYGTELFNIEIVIQLIEQQKEEIENLKIENTLLQPIYSRRVLEERMNRYEQALKEIVKDSHTYGHYDNNFEIAKKALEVD
jgi:hypothetical protein